MNSDELSHIIKQHVAQALVDQKSFIYGHIANYDPVAHKVRLVVPSLRDESGLAMLTPWMPFGTTGAGQGGGFQYHPFTGATPTDPTRGEQCMIMLLDKDRGIAAASTMFFGPGDSTPASALPADAKPFSPGEYILAQKTGSFIRLHADGEIEMSVSPASKFLTTVGTTSMQIDPSGFYITGPVTTDNNLTVGNGATGTLTDTTGQVATVRNGIITDIT